MPKLQVDLSVTVHAALRRVLLKTRGKQINLTKSQRVQFSQIALEHGPEAANSYMDTLRAAAKSPHLGRMPGLVEAIFASVLPELEALSTQELEARLLPPPAVSAIIPRKGSKITLPK